MDDYILHFSCRERKIGGGNGEVVVVVMVVVIVVVVGVLKYSALGVT